VKYVYEVAVGDEGLTRENFYVIAQSFDEAVRKAHISLKKINGNLSGVVFLIRAISLKGEVR
jgi:hypothetical protein